MTHDAFIKAVETLYKKNGEPLRAEGAAQYMRNQFSYFGIATPERRQLTKQLINELEIPAGKKLDELIRKLWLRDKRECQYFAMELLERQMKKGEEVSVSLIEFMIQHKSWWDTVDFIAPKLAGEIFKKDKDQLEKITSKWYRSKNLWLKRSAIILQLKYKKKTNMTLLFKVILDSASEKDFFIRKAIGWSLREYAKTNPEGVKEFVRENELALSGLSKREALRRIK
jgi:3-methyladenine DNA glycosylase AlkD